MTHRDLCGELHGNVKAEADPFFLTPFFSDLCIAPCKQVKIFVVNNSPMQS